MRQLLDDTEIERGLSELSGWAREGNALRKTFEFAGFREAIAFVNRVAGVAEEMNHHPDLDIRYNKVRATLSTHSSGGITRLDLVLARAMDAALDAA
ncbi:MAG TPA: 4a-hydroxytetrahydrobiopterin dehydratase [Gemmatimonadaceae bacterium]|jgi:4a-hydroxytetrahydrobiopterin dehydratase|nr:4a-hydroxytetrahydrobiopterin dehydratase [Gemmatimonadaceae bacterium]